MNQEIANRAQQILLDALQRAEDSMLFVEGQIPLIVEELLRWKFFESFFTWLACLVIVSLVFFWWIRDFKQIKKGFEEVGYSDYSSIVKIVSFISILPMLALFNSTDWLQIWLAPRVYLLEYAAKLVR